jgi:CheY-like chemotaxis protein/signal transduction histidine kinase
VIRPTGNRFEWASAAALLMLLAIFLLDLQVPRGYAVSALYLLPVGLTLMQRLSWAPFVIAAIASVLVWIGYFESGPAFGTRDVSLFNRGASTVAPWLLAAFVWKVLQIRGKAEHLARWRQAEAAVNARLLGELTVTDTCNGACAALCEAFGAETAVMYLLDGNALRRCGAHAPPPEGCAERIALGEGVLGQVAADGRARLLADVDATHLAIASALGRSAARHVLVAPVASGKRTLAVIELGFLRRTAGFDAELEFIAAVAERIGTSVRAAQYHERVQALLEQTQEQAQSLQAQQEELRVSNEELEEQSRGLRQTQARLEAQQAELEHSNAQLEQQTRVLHRQRSQLLGVQQALREKAGELEASSRYKSEFLANMSHELRTPLNSSLILSRLLCDNKAGNLSEEQVRWAQAIHSSNNDLLALINDILDLARIEAGHVEVVAGPFSLTSLLDRLRSMFGPLAQQKGLGFSIEVDPEVADRVVSDQQRLKQVLNNLLANAVKFTEHGSVRLRVHAPAEGRLAFEVADTGIGIPRDRLELIFDAFRQADGGTSRRYGGTGLGLSIARQLARRLGGDIEVDSEPGRGSVFTLRVPTELALGADSDAAQLPPPAAERAGAAGHGSDADDVPAAPLIRPPAAAPRIERHGRERLVLVVEDDPQFAELLGQLVAEMEFDVALAATAADALRLARELRPSGILLDVGLPDESGLNVLERLKRDPATRHIPVHVVSNYDRSQTALELGAIGYVMKPTDREALQAVVERLQERLQRDVRRLLIVEDDAELRGQLGTLLAAEGVEITAVGRMDEALAELAAHSFDCMVLDISLPDGTGYELLETMAGGEQYAFPPVIVYTGRALGRDEEQRLRRYSKSIIIKGARSPERLLDEVTLFLHSVEGRLPPPQQRMLEEARQRDSVLDGRRILLVEDDVRNIFALSSVFEPLGAELVIARNGREAVERLDRAADIDLVLMDVMMPEMDGITAMRLIRERPALASLPIIALTAKAMADDREQCLAAGANDYIAKPIDLDKLVSLCRVWMPK